jgi:hypothetical protein
MVQAAGDALTALASTVEGVRGEPWNGMDNVPVVSGHSTYTVGSGSESHGR